MCLSLHRARLTNTILYAAETHHDGRILHVLGYQNRAENQSKGPNAMLLPIPSDADMGPDNMLDTTAAKYILKDYVTSLRATYDGMKGFGGGRRSRGLSRGAVQVFEKGSYTVALAEDAADLPAALERIPENKRPAANDAIFEAYASLYPGWKMALCAWDGTVDAEPLLWQYEPKDLEHLFMPALDAHDGNPPKLGSDVTVDHTLIVGSVVAPPARYAVEVRFRDPIPEHLKPFLATHFHGQEFNATISSRPEAGLMKNGDFVVRVANMRGPFERVDPPGRHVGVVPS